MNHRLAGVEVLVKWHKEELSFHPNAIGHFRITVSLFFEASPGTHPFK